MPLQPNQIRLDDGFSTIIEFANLPTVKLFETEVTPPGYQGGGPIETTTMRNVAYRTQAPKRLKTLAKMTAVCAYATEALPQIWAQIGKNQLVQVTFPDGSGLHFYGWIDEFVPGAHKEGTQPTATLTVLSSMRDNQGDEVAPKYLAVEESSSGV